MKKITNIIVKFRYIFLIIFLLFACFSLYLEKKVNINDDIMKYLPKNSETKIGNEIMEKSFAKQSSSNLEVMFKDLSDSEKETTLNKLSAIKGVSSVSYDKSEKYNKGKYSLYNLSVDDYSDSVLATNVYENVRDNFDTVAMSGSIFEENKPLLQTWIVVFAIACAMLILIILSESWFEPFLYLISIGIAVFINKGTNIMFGSVSSITNSIVAVLQLALSMDYSIMLSNRYKQEKKKHENKNDAMKEALYHSFKAISSSSLTTIVGLLALVFMSFTIGKDLGFVLAKGVLLSLISIFFCLPALILLFDKFLEKTKKKAFKFKLNKLGRFSCKTRFGQSIFIVALFIAVFMIKGSVQILYTDIQQDKVGEVFGSNNQIAIVYNNKNVQGINNLLLAINDDEKIDSILSYDLIFNSSFTSDELLKVASSVSSSNIINQNLINFIYYLKFDGSIHENISLNDIKDIISQNEMLYSFVSSKVNLKQFNKLSDVVDLDKKLPVKEMSNILNIDERIVSLFYMYNSSLGFYNNSWKASINEFVTFFKTKLSSYEDLSKYLSPADKAKLLVLSNKVKNIKPLLVSEKYSRIVLNTSYPKEGKETFEFIKKIKDKVEGLDDVYVVGLSPMAYEMNKSFNSELNKITILTFIFIFIVVALAFRDFIIPFILVLIIQCAVYLTMSYISITGGSVYFLSILIVQAILMGATIDYAIVYTSYYREARLKKGVQDSIISAYKGSINTILSSSSILIIVTLIVANFANAIAAKICQTVSQGTFCALILVIFVLPGVLAATDKLICRKGFFKEEK